MLSLHNLNEVLARYLRYAPRIIQDERRIQQPQSTFDEVQANRRDARDLWVPA